MQPTESQKLPELLQQGCWQHANSTQQARLAGGEEGHATTSLRLAGTLWIPNLSKHLNSRFPRKVQATAVQQQQA